VSIKKRKREGKEEEKRRLIKKQIYPHLFLISSPFSPNFIIGKKREFSNSLKDS
jgi:hypothetical protein